MSDGHNEYAFPLQHTIVDANDPFFKRGQEGMTLRDYFAAKALTSLIEAMPHTKAKKLPFQKDETIAEMIARISYGYADAMIKAREVQP